MGGTEEEENRLPGVGVLGTGRMAAAVVPLLRSAGFHVVALWGRTAAEASSAAASLGVPAWSARADDILLRRDVGLVWVACAPRLRAQLAVKALGIGKHVVCAAPAGLGEPEARRLLRAAQYYPALIALAAHGLRYAAGVSAARTAIAGGYVGTLALVEVRLVAGGSGAQAPEWAGCAASGGGVVAGAGGHAVDLVAFLSGQRAVRVHAVAAALAPAPPSAPRPRSAPDFASFQMHLSAGALATVTLNARLHGCFEQEVIIVGSGGYLRLRGDDVIGWREERGEEIVLCGNQSEQDDMSSDGWDGALPGPHADGLRRMVASLREAFAGGGELGWAKAPVADAATFEDGLYVHAVLAALSRSAAQRRWIRVSVSADDPDPDPALSAAVRRSALTA